MTFTQLESQLDTVLETEQSITRPLPDEPNGELTLRKTNGNQLRIELTHPVPANKSVYTTATKQPTTTAYTFLQGINYPYTTLVNSIANATGIQKQTVEDQFRNADCITKTNQKATFPIYIPL